MSILAVADKNDGPQIPFENFLCVSDQTQGNATLAPERAPARRTEKSNSFHIDFEIDEKFYMRPAKLRRRVQNLNDTKSCR